MENNFRGIIFFVNVKMRAKHLSLTWKKWTSLSHRDIVKKGDFTCKLKLKGGYFCMSLPEDSRKYVRFYWQGNLYQFFCLCFGLAPAPYIFTKLLKVKVQVAFLHRVGTLIIIYLEDMLILSKSVGEILVYKDTIILLMQELGFVIRDMNPLRICEIAWIKILVANFAIIQR